MTCGNLQKIEGGFIRGQYKVWGKPVLNFDFIENKDKANKDTLPDFLIEAKDPCGDRVVIGHAWRNDIRKGEKAGLNCYSLQFTEPMLFKRPVKLSAFPSNPDGSRYDLDYDRERTETAQQAA